MDVIVENQTHELEDDTNADGIRELEWSHSLYRASVFYRKIIQSRSFCHLFKQYQPKLLTVSEDSISYVHLIYRYVFEEENDAVLRLMNDPGTITPELFEALEDMRFVIRDEKLTLDKIDDFYHAQLEVHLLKSKEIFVQEILKEVKSSPDFIAPVIGQLDRLVKRIEAQHYHYAEEQIKFNRLKANDYTVQMKSCKDVSERDYFARLLQDTEYRIRAIRELKKRFKDLTTNPGSVFSRHLPFKGIGILR